MTTPNLRNIQKDNSQFGTTHNTINTTNNLNPVIPNSYLEQYKMKKGEKKDVKQVSKKNIPKKEEGLAKINLDNLADWDDVYKDHVKRKEEFAHLEQGQLNIQNNSNNINDQSIFDLNKINDNINNFNEFIKNNQQSNNYMKSSNDIKDIQSFYDNQALIDLGKNKNANINPILNQKTSNFDNNSGVIYQNNIINKPVEADDLVINNVRQSNILDKIPEDDYSINTSNFTNKLELNNNIDKMDFSNLNTSEKLIYPNFSRELNSNLISNNVNLKNNNVNNTNQVNILNKQGTSQPYQKKNHLIGNTNNLNEYDVIKEEKEESQIHTGYNNKSENNSRYNNVFKTKNNQDRIINENSNEANDDSLENNYHIDDDDSNLEAVKINKDNSNSKNAFNKLDVIPDMEDNIKDKSNTEIDYNSYLKQGISKPKNYILDNKVDDNFITNKTNDKNASKNNLIKENAKISVNNKNNDSDDEENNKDGFREQLSIDQFQQEANLTKNQLEDLNKEIKQVLKEKKLKENNEVDLKNKNSKTNVAKNKNAGVNKTNEVGSKSLVKAKYALKLEDNNNNNKNNSLNKFNQTANSNLDLVSTIPAKNMNYVNNNEQNKMNSVNNTTNVKQYPTQVSNTNNTNLNNVNNLNNMNNMNNISSLGMNNTSNLNNNNSSFTGLNQLSQHQILQHQFMMQNYPQLFNNNLLANNPYLGGNYLNNHSINSPYNPIGNMTLNPHLQQFQQIPIINPIPNNITTQILPNINQFSNINNQFIPGINIPTSQNNNSTSNSVTPLNKNTIKQNPIPKALNKLQQDYLTNKDTTDISNKILNQNSNTVNNTEKKFKRINSANLGKKNIKVANSNNKDKLSHESSFVNNIDKSKSNISINNFNNYYYNNANNSNHSIVQNNNQENQNNNKNVNYKPHTVKEYKEKLEEWKKKEHYKGLGPNVGTKEWNERKERQEKIKNYSKSVAKIKDGKDNEKVNVKENSNYNNADVSELDKTGASIFDKRIEEEILQKGGLIKQLNNNNNNPQQATLKTNKTKPILDSVNNNNLNSKTLVKEQENIKTELVENKSIKKIGHIGNIRNLQSKQVNLFQQNNIVTTTTKIDKDKIKEKENDREIKTHQSKRNLTEDKLGKQNQVSNLLRPKSSSKPVKVFSKANNVNNKQDSKVPILNNQTNQTNQIKPEIKEINNLDTKKKNKHESVNLITSKESEIQNTYKNRLDDDDIDFDLNDLHDSLDYANIENLKKLRTDFEGDHKGKHKKEALGIDREGSVSYSIIEDNKIPFNKSTQKDKEFKIPDILDKTNSVFQDSSITHLTSKNLNNNKDTNKNVKLNSSSLANTNTKLKKVDNKIIRPLSNKKIKDAKTENNFIPSDEIKLLLTQNQVLSSKVDKIREFVCKIDK